MKVALLTRATSLRQHPELREAKKGLAHNCCQPCSSPESFRLPPTFSPQPRQNFAYNTKSSQRASGIARIPSNQLTYLLRTIDDIADRDFSSFCNLQGGGDGGDQPEVHLSQWPGQALLFIAHQAIAFERIYYRLYSLARPKTFLIASFRTFLLLFAFLCVPARVWISTLASRSFPTHARTITYRHHGQPLLHPLERSAQDGGRDSVRSDVSRGDQEYECLPHYLSRNDGREQNKAS